MEDIKIEPQALSNTINVLEKNNQEILDVIKNINKAIKELDETKWSAPNKKEIDEYLLPYIENSEATITTDLGNCIYVLQYALNKYATSDSNIKSETAKLAE